MNLYHIQDADRPMYVIARSWNEAIVIWENKVIGENDADDCEPPAGIMLVCEADELLLRARASMTVAEVNDLRRECKMTYRGGYVNDGDLAVFGHGMDTVCNVLHDRATAEPVDDVLTRVMDNVQDRRDAAGFAVWLNEKLDRAENFDKKDDLDRLRHIAKLLAVFDAETDVA